MAGTQKRPNLVEDAHNHHINLIDIIDVIDALMQAADHIN